MVELGIALLVGALLLLVAEAHLSTGGLIGLIGSVAAVCGVLLLLLAAGAGPLAAVIVALGLGAATVAFLLLMRRRIADARGGRPRTGREALVGHVGVVRGISDGELQVFIDGALWRAEPTLAENGDALHVGDRVVVERVKDLTLDVRRAEAWELVR
jgi:membrane protein implicated in regulation of membrane protease activity